MQQQLSKITRILKILSDEKRLRIIQMLSCGEMCGCEILKAFNITQPTLAADMKNLVDADLVLRRKEGKYVFYSLQDHTLKFLLESLNAIMTPNQDCVCHQVTLSNSTDHCCQ